MTSKTQDAGAEAAPAFTLDQLRSLIEDATANATASLREEVESLRGQVAKAKSGSPTFKPLESQADFTREVSLAMRGLKKRSQSEGRRQLNVTQAGVQAGDVPRLFDSGDSVRVNPEARRGGRRGMLWSQILERAAAGSATEGNDDQYETDEEAEAVAAVSFDGYGTIMSPSFYDTNKRQWVYRVRIPGVTGQLGLGLPERELLIA